MSELEKKTQYVIPYKIPEQNTNSGWPKLKPEFQSHQMLEETYVLRRNIMGEGDSRTVSVRQELEQLEKKLITEKKQPFSPKFLTDNQKRSVDNVVSETFLPLDPDLPEGYEADRRETRSLSINYRNDHINSWRKYAFSMNPSERSHGFNELNIPDQELTEKIISLVRGRTLFMNKKSGSVGQFFQERDGIDWQEIFDDVESNTAIYKYSLAYSKRRSKSLETDALTPSDFYAASKIETENSVQLMNALGNPTIATRDFLHTLGLGEIAENMLFINYRNTGGYLIHAGRNWQPKPVVFYSKYSPYREGSLSEFGAHVHEAGHAAAHYIGEKASSPLFSLQTNVAEIPSFLLQRIFIEKYIPLKLGSGVVLPKPTAVFNILTTLYRSEFEYRLYELAQHNDLSSNSIGELFSELTSKYFGVRYANKVDSTWQYLCSGNLSHSKLFQGRSYTVGVALSEQIIKSLYTSDESFGEIFEEMFKNGPFTSLQDFEKLLGISTAEAVKEKLFSEVEAELI